MVLVIVLITFHFGSNDNTVLTGISNFARNFDGTPDSNHMVMWHSPLLAREVTSQISILPHSPAPSLTIFTSSLGSLGLYYTLTCL